MGNRGLEFRILGSLEVWRDGEPVRLGGERQRALLALLLVRANELVSTDQLVEELFGGERSAAAVNAARVAVSRLRRLFENGEDDGVGVLTTRPGGYVLQISPEQLDAAVFERLLTEGRQLLASGNPTSASARLREALSLWRGPPFADVALLEFLQSEIRRLEELRLVALMERIDADLAVGAAGELIGELESLVAANPLQERPRGQLMLALYRAGRQADALEVYRQTSELLRDELGLEPGPALKALQADILAQAGALEYKTLGPIQVPRAGRGVPRPAAPMIGRECELADISTILREGDVGLVTLTGPGGVGKTRLARAVAREVGQEFPDGVCWVELSGEQLSRVVDEKVKHQAATFSSVVVVSSSVTLIPSLNFTPASTSPTSSWPLNRRQRSWAASSSL